MKPKTCEDINDMIDQIAQERMENANEDELEIAYYEDQYDKIKLWPLEEITEVWNDLFSEEQ